MFEKFSAKPHLPLNRPFFKDQNTVMLSRDHGKTLKISKIQPCQVCHNKRFAVFFRPFEQYSTKFSNLQSK